MKFPSILRGGLLATAFLGLLGSRSQAQDITPPVVVNPIRDITVGANSAPTLLSLDDVFALQGVKGTMVRMTTNAGKIDVELFDDVAPNTVANFLRYVTTGSYTDTVFHKVKRNPSGTSVSLLGGEYALIGGSVNFITTFGNVDNEYSLPNTAGTIAMYKQSSSPDSAADQWFFNVTDNSKKFGSNNDGGYTVFGRVIGNGLTRVDAIAGLKTYDLTSLLGKKFNDVPLYDYDPSQTVAANNLVVATSVAELPLVSSAAGTAGALKITVTENTNPAVITPEISGDKLILKYVAGMTGASTITLQAKDQAKTKTPLTFHVTVK